MAPTALESLYRSDRTVALTSEQYLFRELGNQNIEFTAITSMSVDPIGEYPLMNKGLFAVAALQQVKKRRK